MIDLFDKFYSSLKENDEKTRQANYYSALRFIIRLTVNLITPIYYYLTKYNKSYSITPSQRKEGRIIITLTSFPVRIGRVWLVIETILRQTKKPDKIILWLSKEQFSSVDLLPKKLLKQRNRGLEIRLIDGDIRSYKKYYYTLQEFPNDYMLIIDDDIFYRSTMIENLCSYSIRYPKSIIAQYTNKIQWVNDKLDAYASWPTLREETPPNQNSFFGSGGGTLFPPYSMDKDALNMDIFLNLAPNADDIWLNVMCKLRGTKVTQTNYYSTYLPILYFKNSTLDSKNNGLNQNDQQLLTVREYYIKSRGIDPFKINL